jgi:hypothetical protein
VKADALGANANLLRDFGELAAVEALAIFQAAIILLG